jgi:hypothetical protein
MTADDYRLAMTLLDEGVDRCAALLVKHNRGAAYKALLSPVEYADLALRLSHALAEPVAGGEQP